MSGYDARTSIPLPVCVVRHVRHVVGPITRHSWELVYPYRCHKYEYFKYSYFYSFSPGRSLKKVVEPNVEVHVRPSQGRLYQWG